MRLLRLIEHRPTVQDEADGDSAALEEALGSGHHADAHRGGKMRAAHRVLEHPGESVPDLVGRLDAWPWTGGM